VSLAVTIDERSRPKIGDRDRGMCIECRSRAFDRGWDVFPSRGTTAWRIELTRTARCTVSRQRQLAQSGICAWAPSASSPWAMHGRPAGCAPASPACSRSCGHDQVAGRRLIVERQEFSGDINSLEAL